MSKNSFKSSYSKKTVSANAITLKTETRIYAVIQGLGHQLRRQGPSALLHVTSTSTTLK